jgi:hypothetical protein
LTISPAYCLPLFFSHSKPKPTLTLPNLVIFFSPKLLLISTLYRSNFRIQVRIVLGKSFFVRANIMPNIFYRVWHRICSACHFGRNRGFSAILAVNPPYGGEFAVSLPSRGLGSRKESGLPVILLGFHPHRLAMFFAS